MVAEFRDLQGVVTDGENMDSALANIIEAVSAYLESEGEAKKNNLIVERSE